MEESRQTGNSEQLLTFFVMGDEYGVDILRVQEIREFTTPMPVPNTPTYIKGVINIRGDIVPIADLRERLGLPRGEVGLTSAVVVLRVTKLGRQRVMGIVVDAMSDVTTVPVENIKQPPDLGGKPETALARGIATLADKMITILNVDQIFEHQPAAPAAHAA